MQLQIFKFEEEDHFSQLRTIEIDGEVWFVGNDVAKTLGYKRPNDAIRQHCKDRGTVKHRIPTESGEQDMILINESNVYRLVIKSQLPSAERFEEWIFEEVLPSIRKKGYYGKIDRTALPNFITRYKENYHKLDRNYFSVISEMFARLYMELEKVGYVIPDKGMHGKQLMPDISVGIIFSNYLKKINSEFNGTHKYYDHTFEDGRSVEARQYPIDALPVFIRFLNEKWIPENSTAYFKGRDPLALEYLPKLLGGGKAA